MAELRKQFHRITEQHAEIARELERIVKERDELQRTVDEHALVIEERDKLRVWAREKLKYAESELIVIKHQRDDLMQRAAELLREYQNLYPPEHRKRQAVEQWLRDAGL